MEGWDRLWVGGEHAHFYGLCMQQVRLDWKCVLYAVCGASLGCTLHPVLALDWFCMLGLGLAWIGPADRPGRLEVLKASPAWDVHALDPVLCTTWSVYPRPALHDISSTVCSSGLGPAHTASGVWGQSLGPNQPEYLPCTTARAQGARWVWYPWFKTSSLCWNKSSDSGQQNLSLLSIFFSLLQICCPSLLLTGGNLHCTFCFCLGYNKRIKQNSEDLSWIVISSFYVPP